MRAEIALMSGSAFAVTHHAFSSGAGRTSDGNGSHASTLKSPSYTKSVSWQHYQGYNDEANGSRGNKTRLAYAGLNIEQFGSLDYGRNYGVGYDIGAWTDVLPEFGGDTWSQKDVFMTYRTTGVATYRNYDFFGLIEGLNFAAQYQGKNERTDGGHLYGADYIRANGDGFGISSTYVYDGFGIGAVYTKSDRTDAQERAAVNPLNASGKNAELWATGLKYDANNLYLAANYAETLNMTTYGDSYISNKAQSFEIVAQYQFDFGLRPSLAYLKSKGKELGHYGDQDLIEYIDVGATYYFNKNMSTYVDYKINLIDESDFTRAVDIHTDNIVATGITYQF
ncbi:porin [Escherichia albertii]|uniref:porin n=2 Tax=Enterobacteriaceae TaxID=543 RepID=UPI003C12B7C9